jgi:SAM-dependent methyltransferase
MSQPNDDKYLSRPEKFTKDENEIRIRHESNRTGWNEGARHGYSPSVGLTIEFIRSGKSSLHTIERAYLAEYLHDCDLAIHLQCASGRDTLSLLNEGVKRVIGVDISDVQIENAKRIGAALNANAEWYRCDLLDTPAELNGRADLIYTGRGAVNWIQDLDAWARVVNRLLKPGGVFWIFDGHPFTWLFKTESNIYEYSGVNYFAHCESGAGWPDTYIGDINVPVEKQSRKYECLWPVSSIFQALSRAGLTILHFGEHPDTYWNEFPNLKPELNGRIPNTFSMLAKRL